MKTIRSISVAVFFAAIFAVSGFAQTTPTANAGRTVVINTAAFADEKAGISKYITAATALENELKPAYTELQTMNANMEKLAAEIQTLQAQAQNGKVPVDQKAAQAKVDQYQNMQVVFKRKQEDFKNLSERRQDQVLGPITDDIMKSIQEFTKQKGYGLVLDAAKLGNAGIILGYDEGKVDVTKEFITFYNTRPPGTTATTAK